MPATTQIVDVAVVAFEVSFSRTTMAVKAAFESVVARQGWLFMEMATRNTGFLWESLPWELYAMRGTGVHQGMRPRSFFAPCPSVSVSNTDKKLPFVPSNY